MSKVLISFQTNYLANPEGKTDRVTSQRSERIDFYCNRDKADTKMFPYIKLHCDNIRVNRVIIVSPGSDVAVISLYQSVTNLTFLDALWFKTGTGDDQRYIPIDVLAPKLGLLICCQGLIQAVFDIRKPILDTLIWAGPNLNLSNTLSNILGNTETTIKRNSSFLIK